MKSLLLNNKSAGFNPIQFVLGFLIGAILFGVLSSFASNALNNPGFEYGSGTDASNWIETYVTRTADCGRNGSGDWCMSSAISPSITNPGAGTGGKTGGRGPE